MAVFIAAADGNLSSAGAVWKTVDATSLLYAVNASTALTTSYVESAGFVTGVITVTGIAVHIASRAASPTGTMSVRLATGGVLVAGTEVTINVSDIDRPGGVSLHAPGLYFFKFAAPVALAAATTYTVSAKTSSASQVNLYRNATAGNWSRMLRTDTFGNPGAGDDWHILGEWTAAATKTNRAVIMDETVAVDYGSGSTDLNLQGISIGKGGTLTFGNTAATNYVLQASTGIRVWAGGILNVGTTLSPIPRDGTATIQFDCAADGDFGMLVDGTANLQGLSRTSGKNVVQCLLNTDEAAAQTVLGVDTDTGWKNGDIVDIASTTRTFSQSEQRTMNADATSTTITVSAGLTNAHSGTSPTQAEVILLTRNVIVRSVSTTAMAFFTVGDTGTVDADWVWFRYLGTATDYKQGVQIRNNGGTSSAAFNFCSVSDFEGYGMVVGGTNISTMANVTIADVVFSSRQAATINHAFATGFSTGTNLSFTNMTVTAIDGSAGTREGFSFLAMPYAVISGIRASGCEASGITLTTPTTTAEILCHGTLSNFNSHSNQTNGINVNGSFSTKISTLTVWRNNVNTSEGGVSYTGPGILEVNSGTIFGNNLQNFFLNGPVNFIGRGLTVAGDTTFATVDGVEYNGSQTVFFARWEGCSFGPTSGIFVPHTNDMTFGGGRKTVDVALINTILASATELASTSVLQGLSVIRYQKQDGVANTHLTNWVNWGTVSRDTTISHMGAPSERLTPGTLALTQMRFQSAPRQKPVAAGETVSIQCYILRDATYTGSAPRLMLKANAALGVNADTLLFTSVGVAGTWELLSGMTPAAPEAGAWQFYVDCDGLVGFINTDDWL